MLSLGGTQNPNSPIFFSASSPHTRNPNSQNPNPWSQAVQARVKAATATVGGSGVDDDRQVVSCSSMQETERRRANLAMATGPVRVASSETKEMSSDRRDRRRWRGDCQRLRSSRPVAGAVQAGEARQWLGVSQTLGLNLTQIVQLTQ